ncbi:MAG: family transporter protein [Schlesneria sp.]|nr:family transporter protein [Schlesneria sp.]
MNVSDAVAPLSRLLWKEYRAQRSLWLAMLVLGVVPQILLRLTIGEAAPRVGLVWITVGVLPFLFVIGSTAILFAGEREERTVDWLLNLAAPPQWTLLAKWAFLLLATLALAATLSVSALLLVWTGPGMADSDRWQGERLDNGTIVFRWVVVFAGVFLWGVLGSLVSRRVITAVPASGFLWLMTFIVPVIWFPVLLGFKTVVQDRVATLAFVAVGIANLVLGWLWCQGRYLDATVLDAVGLKIAARWNRLWGRTATKVRLPKRLEFDNPWGREWQRLVWQERYRDRYHRGLLYLGWAVSLVLAVLGGMHGGDIMPVIVPLIVVLPMVMGVLGFRYDGEGQPTRFLSNRGVEARFLWLAKHAVWLPRAVWIPFLIWLVAGLMQSLLPRQVFTAPGNHLLENVSLLRTYPVGMLAFVLLSYGCGHLGAILFRRTIMAIVVGLTASLLATFWLLLAVTLNVPLWWSVGGLILWIYAVTFLVIPSWLIERPLPGRLQRLAAYMVPPVLLIAAWGAWRAYEIPGFHPNLLSSKQSFERINTANVRKEQLGLAAVPTSPSDQQLLDRLALLMGGFNREQDFVQGLHRGGAAAADPNQPADPVEAFWHNNEPRLKELLEITSMARGPSASRWLEFAKPSAAMMPQELLLVEAGRLRTREGRLEEAFQYYLASLRLASYWATDSGVSTRLEAQQQQLLTLDGIVQWASHPDQDSEKLRSARRRLQAEFDLFPSINQTLVAEHRGELVELEETIQQGARWSRGRESAWQLFTIDYFRLLPWEKVRAKRWLEEQLLAYDQVAKDVTAALRQPGVDVSRRLDHIMIRQLIEEIRDRSSESSWRWTTPLASTELGKGSEIASMLIDREVAIRESLLALSLLAWKQDHQQWPETLIQSLDGLPSIIAVDPWCGENFHYNGSLLNQLEEDGSPVFVLSTVGQNQLREVQIGYGSPSPATELRSWAGVRVISDDRLRLKLEQGRLSFQLPNSIRFAQGGPSGGD